MPPSPSSIEDSHYYIYSNSNNAMILSVGPVGVEHMKEMKQIIQSHNKNTPLPGDIIALTLDFISSKSPPEVATISANCSLVSTPRSRSKFVEPSAKASAFDIFPPDSIATLQTPVSGILVALQGRNSPSQDRTPDYGPTISLHSRGPQ